MSNTVTFLETMGQDAALAHADVDTIAVALAVARIDPAQQAALLAGDSMQLRALLGAKVNVACILFPKKDGEEPDEDEPSRDDDEVSAQHAALCVG